MSHFTVLVPASDEAELEEKLLPYHEYGCTGIEDHTEWVIEVRAEDARARAEEIVTEVRGEKYAAYLAEDDLDAIFRDWSGYTRDEDGNYGHRTNPNAKWDWWTVGGRWAGLLSSYDPAEDPRNWEVCSICDGTGDRPGWVYYESDPENAGVRLRKFAGADAESCNGCNSCHGKGVCRKWSNASYDGDSPLAGDVAWDAILDKQLGDKMDIYRAFQECLALARNGANVESERLERAKSLYNEDSERGRNCRETFASEEDYLLREAAEELLYEHRKIHLWDTFAESADRFYKTEDEYREMFAAEALTYAFIDLEGRWNQCGQMGWFGMSDKSQGTSDYDAAFWAFVKSLPQDQRVYLVDCHI